MLRVCIALPSGQNVHLSVPQSSKVGELKVLAQKAFGHGFVKLVTVEGQVLTPKKSLDEVGIQDGDNLMAIAQQPKLAATGEAFAMWCCGGHGLVTWGSANSGGNSSSAQDKFINVQEIRGTGAAFAAILADGSVVSWGYADSRGDSSKVQGKLQNVKQITATCVAFAAIVADGSVVTWGNPDLGGDSSEVQAQLRNVQQIQATNGAFAAILADGSVVTWGDRYSGGDSSEVQDQLRNVQRILAAGQAFAAILADEFVVTWGNPDLGGDSSKVQGQLQNVKQIKATGGAFAAILADGSVVTWGNPHLGGDSSEVQAQLRNVQRIQATTGAFAAMLADGSVVIWGDRYSGGDSSEVRDQLRNVKEIQATAAAFAAILADGAVLTWGRGLYGGDSSEVQARLRNVQQIQATNGAFAAILADGSVVTWGDRRSGGDSSEVQGQIAYLPLSKEQTDALRQASTIALLGPGDVASFTGGLPHVTVVVGDMLNLTAYESLINWHPSNADLLLRGALRKPGSEGVMKRKALHGIFDDIVQVVRRRVPEALDLHRKGVRRRVVLLPLGSTNDHQGVADGEVWHRAKKTVSLWKSLKSAGSDVQILMSGGADTSRFFNPLETSHWRFVREVLLQLGVPSEELPDGLEALHTVDEALLSRAHCAAMEATVDTVDLLVITSEFHVARARHLFNVAFRDVPNVEVLVLAVPNACDGEKLEAYLKKETETIKCLRQKPYGAWLDFLREHHAEAVNESHQQCEPFVMSSHKAGLLRSAFRDMLRSNKSCRRRLASSKEEWDSSSSRSGEEVPTSKDPGAVDDVQKQKKPRYNK
eukprot:s1196_g5.t1